MLQIILCHLKFKIILYHLKFVIICHFLKIILCHFSFVYNSEIIVSHFSFVYNSEIIVSHFSFLLSAIKPWVMRDGSEDKMHLLQLTRKLGLFFVMACFTHTHQFADSFVFIMVLLHILFQIY